MGADSGELSPDENVEIAQIPSLLWRQFLTKAVLCSIHCSAAVLPTADAGFDASPDVSAHKPRPARGLKSQAQKRAHEGRFARNGEQQGVAEHFVFCVIKK